MTDLLTILQVKEFHDITYRLVSFFIDYSIQILGAIILLLVGWILAGRLTGALTNILGKKGVDPVLTGFFTTLARIIVLVMVGIMALGKFGVDISPLIAVVGGGALGLTLALKGPISNFGSGLAIILTRPFTVGNTITVQGQTGVVETVRLSHTVLSTGDGEHITIPSNKIVGEVLTNTFAHRVVDGSVGVAYATDPEEAIRVVQAALSTVSSVANDPAPQVGILSFGDSAIEIGYRYWAPSKGHLVVRHQVNLAVYQALLGANISIPFPQREIRLLEPVPGAGFAPEQTKASLPT